jgi:glycosyltransferase involved in cell wall biosynthesis
VHLLSRRIRELDPVLVHGNSLKAGYYGSAATRLNRRPFVWHLRDRLANDYLPAAKIRTTRAVMRALTSGVVTCSAAVLESARIANSTLRTEVIYDAYRRSRPAPDRRQTGDEIVVGIVGRLADWKGQDVFLRAFARLREVEPRVRARVIGAAMFADAPYGDYLHRLAEDLGISEVVEFLGFCPDVETELDRLDILVHASTVPEPFGQVIVEGLAAALPVVATNAGGPREILQPGVTGLLYPPGDDTALSKQLINLVQDAMLRAGLGQAGRAAVSRFDPAVIAEQLERFWTTVAAR